MQHLTLWELLARLRKRPRETARYLLAVLQPERPPLPAFPPDDEDARPRTPSFERRRLAQLYGLQCGAIVWLLMLALLSQDAAYSVQQAVLFLWMPAAGLALLVGRAGAFRLAQGFMTLLSLLAVLQWASQAGSAYAAWAGMLGALNLAANMAFLPDDDLHWLGTVGDYLLLVGLWLGFVLAVTADRIMAGPNDTLRRSPALFVQGVPLLYAGAALWGGCLVLVWHRRRIARWVRVRRAGRRPLGRADLWARFREGWRLPRLKSWASRTIQSRFSEGVFFLHDAAPREIAITGVSALAAAMFAALGVGSTLAEGDSPLPLAAGTTALVAVLLGGSLFLLLGAGVRWQRIVLGHGALALSVLAYMGRGGNLFTVEGVLAWLASVALWLWVLRDAGAPLPDGRAWGRRVRAWLRAPALRLNGSLVVLLGILLVGAFFRFYRLEAVPPEMTSDHVEKLLDGARVFGDLAPDYTPKPQIFFPNNGGREPIQMYLVAITARLTGLGYTFTTLKIVSALEALATLPLLYWMGRELAGRRVGLLLAALVAVSYWHTVLGRLALRIVLTPLCIALLVIYLARGMRHNRRADFLKAGGVLGAGMYAYQALRMAPLVVLAAAALAVVFIAKDGRARRRYLMNLTALVVVSLAVFVPLGRYMTDYPEDFWRRAAGRMGIGEDAGGLAPGEAAAQFLVNYNDALWMFNWKGEVQWISNVPNQPHLSPIAGALFAVGVVTWLLRLARRRDPVDWLPVLVLLIMLLPSALSIAQPNENPSATRASGVLPMVYLWAAVALDVLIVQIHKAFSPRMRTLAGVGVVLVIVFSTAAYNYDLFFYTYRDSYAWSDKAYSEIGDVVRGFAQSTGSMETAFIVAYPHWLDHRAVGIEAGDINWENSDKLLDVHDLPQHLPAPRTKAVMVLYNQQDAETGAYLKAAFPEGSEMYYQVRGEDRAKDFYIFTIPPG